MGERKRERGWDGGREGGGSYSLFLEPNLRSNISAPPYVIGHTNWYHVAGCYTRVRITGGSNRWGHLEGWLLHPPPHFTK